MAKERLINGLWNWHVVSQSVSLSVSSAPAGVGIDEQLHDLGHSLRIYLIRMANIHKYCLEHIIIVAIFLIHLNILGDMGPKLLDLKKKKMVYSMVINTWDT